MKKQGVRKNFHFYFGDDLPRVQRRIQVKLFDRGRLFPTGSSSPFGNGFAGDGTFVARNCVDLSSQTNGLKNIHQSFMEDVRAERSPLYIDDKRSIFPSSLKRRE
jgi:hypothetical protein